MIPVKPLGPILTALDEAGAISLNPETFEILRVEAGQPGPEGELLADHTPLEVGLQKMISGSKGCYTGQEVIARQITYDKVSKNLVGVRLNEMVEIGATIKVAGKSAGKLTSVVQSPRFGPIGLAVVRRQYGEAGQEISLVHKDAFAASGEVTALPFR